MVDVDQVEPQKLLARAADDLAEAVVDRSEDAIQIDLAETGHGLRDERRKLLLVLPHGKFAIAHLPRSEEHTSELQSLMRISYAVFCLKKKNNNKSKHKHTHKTHRKHN